MQLSRPLKILILGLNYAPEMVGIAVYTTDLAEALARRRHSVHVVAGKPYYPTWSVQEAFRGGWLRRSRKNGVVITRVAHYVPAAPSGVRRIAHHVSFALSSVLPMLIAARRVRPDVVIAVAPSLIAAPVAKAASLICGAKSWLHIQDFEAEAAIATGLLDKDSFGARAARWFERSVIGLFDRVSSISTAMCSKLAEKGVPAEQITEFRNWADIAAITPLEAPSPYRAEWAITAPHVALYSGNIANKQGIDIIVSTARRLKNRKDLMFVVCGQGPNRSNLEAQAADLTNIIFRDLQPTSRLSDLLGLADIHLLPQLASAADLVLPSKLTNMLASGRPVVATAAANTGLAAEIEGCGIAVEPQAPEAFADAIVSLLDDPALAATLGANARQRAENRWARDAIIDGLSIALHGLAGVEQSAGADRVTPLRNAAVDATPPQGVSTPNPGQ